MEQLRLNVTKTVCHNRQGVLVPLAPEVRERFFEIGLSGFFEGSLFDPVHPVVAVTRFAEID